MIDLIEPSNSDLGDTLDSVRDYIAGIEQRIIELELELKDREWISTKEEIPELNKPVLCKKEDGRKLVSWRTHDERQKGNGALFHHESKHYNGGLITHWMPLPEEQGNE